MSKRTTDSYYNLLGVPKDADNDTIKRAFRNLAKTHHPDKGGDPEKFKDISQAANVLQDPRLRSAYDRDGVAGVEEAQRGSAAADHRDNRGRGGALMAVNVPATLEEIFAGAEKTVHFHWEKPCLECHRTGCKPGKSAKKCRDCRGAGMVMHVRQIGPGMIQQSAHPCATCGGQGVYISRSDRCHICGGKRTVNTEEKIAISIAKGAANHTRQMPVSEAFKQQLEHEVEFVLEQLPHPLFERRGAHLIHKHKAPLVQALTGVSFNLPHVDGKTYHLKTSTPENQVVKPGTIFRIPNFGFNNTSSGQGDLFVQVEVEFPTTLSSQIQLILRRCLPDAGTTTVPLPITSATEKEMTSILPSEAARIIQEALHAEQATRPFYPPSSQMHFAHGGECRNM